MDEDTRREVTAGMIRLGFALLTGGLALALVMLASRAERAASSPDFDPRRWITVRAEAPAPAPSDAEVAAVLARAREILEQEATT